MRGVDQRLLHRIATRRRTEFIVGSFDVKLGAIGGVRYI
jgi:uncharacterized protein (DUF779 family)